MSLSDSVHDPGGRALDGEWTDASSTYPSGDGADGGAFDFAFDVQVGDVDGDGATDFDDFLALQVGWGAGGRTWREGDINGDGNTTIDDFLDMQTAWTAAAGANATGGSRSSSAATLEVVDILADLDPVLP